MLLGIALWLCVLKSAVHATIVGVLLVLCIPSFDTNHLQLATESRLSILLASATAACIGAVLIYWGTCSRRIKNVR